MPVDAARALRPHLDDLGRRRKSGWSGRWRCGHRISRRSNDHDDLAPRGPELLQLPDELTDAGRTHRARSRSSSSTRASSVSISTTFAAEFTMATRAVAVRAGTAPI